ncbi:hypothetical protein NLM33_08845 [Bradyrhizobium sp. CCGUVB1N3]|uniref:hypothetical protein n=1 Tax=Bradyrhizobium sp. CCGUVB1N3 TaxID=2949629 RepID=UPI0020B2ADB3|nr:hypothetical protein [Bradyrhizobium sp. CCGUVB1N3]MCP3470427.1 hypothetical protein [Bradyrhizobium sp. CCGUVB1N3]
MESLPDQKARPRRRPVIVLVLLSLLLIACFVAMYYAGDLSKYQAVVSAEETRAALRDVTDADQLDQVIKLHPSNKLLRLLALANSDAMEIDAAMRKLLGEVEPKPLPKLGDLGASSRGDLEALRRDLKTAESNAASLAPRYAEVIKTTRDRIENDARSLNLGDKRLSGFMARIDEQHAAWTALTAKALASRADYFNAFDKCVALLVRELGVYKVANGQFIFPFQSTADSYNRAATAMTAAATRAAELDDESKGLRPSQLAKWKAFVDG